VAQQVPGAVQTIVGTPALMGMPNVVGIVAGTMMPSHWNAAFIAAWGSQVAADGAASRSLAVQLHRNALVRRFAVRVGAARAEAVLLGNAAQVREQSASGGRRTVVADFGTLATVASVGVLGAGGLVFATSSGILIHEVKAWTGLAFARDWLYVDPPSTGATGTMHAVFGETRTERLLIEVSGADSMDELLANLWVELPDPPTDLSIRIDGGPPVWTSPGPVRPGQGGWSADGAQTVELGPALAALAGDPDDDSLATFTLVLASRTAGRLEIAEAPGGRDLSYLARVRPGGSDAVDVAFELEGRKRVPLPLPAWTRRVERVALTATATPGPERAVPPVGPDAAGTAELVLDADRSACVRLPAASGLAELVALRLPLRAGPAGAEVRVVLLAAKADGEPGEPLDGGSSGPVALDPPAAGAAEAWSTFELPAPVALEGPAPWAAVQVARGQAVWPLGQAVPEVPGVAVPDRALRRGPPAGPWHELPAVVRALGGRVRVVGHAAREAPMAPLVVQVEGSAALPAADPLAVRATPGPRGVSVEWAAAPDVEPRSAGGAKSVDLVVTSHLPGVVTLRDVVVTAKR
jgi:hypothetical protein